MPSLIDIECQVNYIFIYTGVIHIMIWMSSSSLSFSILLYVNISSQRQTIQQREQRAEPQRERVRCVKRVAYAMVAARVQIALYVTTAPYRT